MDFMTIDNLPDWEKRLERQDAFWECEIIDRPVISMCIYKEKSDCLLPAENKYNDCRERWLDSKYQAECARLNVANTKYLGDALPSACPNIGPEVLSSFFGTELEFGESTVWSVPNLCDWNDVGKLQFSEDNFFWKKVVEMTDLFLESGKNYFYTGMTDLHPGGDTIASFRDPVKLNIDMIESADQVKALLSHLNRVYFKIYDFFYEKLSKKNQPVTNWTGIVSTKKWSVISNDFSCMISKEMFDDIFLPEIIEECQHLEASIYHLDGPGALRHLDSLLKIKELSAIQWVCGAGNGRSSDWLNVYKKCQNVGKALQIHINVDELNLFMQELKPEGLWFAVGGVKDEAHADRLLKKISKKM